MGRADLWQRSAGGAASLQSNPEVIAGQGYAVLVPSLPRDRATGEPAAGLADQVLALVDAAIATGWVDPNRLALWGHSFGGYGALAVAGQTDRFKSAIAKAAVVDLAAFRGAVVPHNAAVPEDGSEFNFGTGWTELGQGHLETRPGTGPERYRRNSPIHLVERIKAPVPLIAGDQDEVPIGSTTSASSTCSGRWIEVEMAALPLPISVSCVTLKLDALRMLQPVGSQENSGLAALGR